MSAAVPVAAEPTVILDEGVESRLGDGGGDFSGWFCVATDLFPCPAAGCAFVASHMTASHLIVVWPRIDDPALLASAENAKAVGRSPRVVEYEQGFGPCVAWDEWVRRGKPIHDRLERPDGWADRPSRI